MVMVTTPNSVQRQMPRNAVDARSDMRLQSEMRRSGTAFCAPTTNPVSLWVPSFSRVSKFSSDDEASLTPVRLEALTDDDDIDW